MHEALIWSVAIMRLAQRSIGAFGGIRAKHCRGLHASPPDLSEVSGIDRGRIGEATMLARPARARIVFAAISDPPNPFKGA
jgi:hypothetical protein